MLERVKRFGWLCEALGHRVILAEPDSQPSQQRVTRFPHLLNLSLRLTEALVIQWIGEYPSTHGPVRLGGSVKRDSRLVKDTTQVGKVRESAVVSKLFV